MRRLDLANCALGRVASQLPFEGRKAGFRMGAIPILAPPALRRHGWIRHHQWWFPLPPVNRRTGVGWVNGWSGCGTNCEEGSSERAGLDAAKYAGHSLRWAATSDAIAGASERGIMAQTGHRSVQMVRRYMRDRSLFRRSARKLGV